MAAQLRAPVFQHFHEMSDAPTSSDDQVRLLCKYCDKFVAGSYRITSNFHSHMRRWHPNIWVEYAKPGNTTITEFGSSFSPTYWKEKDVKQYELASPPMINNMGSNTCSSKTPENQVIKIESDDDDLSDEVVTLDDAGQPEASSCSDNDYSRQNELISHLKPHCYNISPQNANGRQIEDANLMAVQRNISRKVPVIFQHFLPVDEPPTAAGSFKMMCIYCSKRICGSNKITSNFHTHIRRIHPNIAIYPDFPNSEASYSEENDVKLMEPTSLLTTQSNNNPPSKISTFHHQDLKLKGADDDVLLETLPQTNNSEPKQSPSSSDENDARQVFPISLLRTQSYNMAPQMTDGRQFEQANLLTTQSYNMAAEMVNQNVDGRPRRLVMRPRYCTPNRKTPIIFQHFLAVDEPPSIDGKFKMMCKYCSKLICGSNRITSNFHTHMRRRHPDIPIDPSQPDPFQLPLANYKPLESPSCSEDSYGRQVEQTSHPTAQSMASSSESPSWKESDSQLTDSQTNPLPIQSNNLVTQSNNAGYQSTNLATPNKMGSQSNNMASQSNSMEPQNNNMIPQKIDERQFKLVSPPATPIHNTIPQRSPDFDHQDVKNQTSYSEEEIQTNSETSQSSNQMEDNGSQVEQNIKVEAPDGDASQVAQMSFDSEPSQAQFNWVDIDGKQADLSSFLAIQNKPPIFQHFHIPADSTCSTGQLKLICKYCGKFVSGSDRATSNFHTHVKRWHPDVQIEAGQPGPTQVRLPNIPAFWKEDDRRHIELTDLLVKFISNTLQPLSVVDDPYFCALLLKAQPSYNMPNHQNLSAAISTKREHIQQRITCSIQKATVIAVTVDFWKSKSMQTYIGITGHFIEDFELESVVLACKRLKGPCSPENVVKHYHEVIHTLNLDGKVGTVVTHSITGISKQSIQFLGLEGSVDAETDTSEEQDVVAEIDDDDKLFESLPSHIPCFFRALQLVIKDGLKEIGEASSIITKASRLSHHICKSGLASDIFGVDFEAQAKNDTLWIGVIEMLRTVVSADIEKMEQLSYDGTLTKHEIEVLVEIIDILTPFEVATDKCKGDKIVTASLVIPCIRGLHSVLQDMSAVHMANLLNVLKSSIETHLSKYENMEVFQLSAAMDPRFKLHWCNADEVQTMKALMVDNVAGLCPQETAASSPTSAEPPKKKSKLFQFMTPTRNPEVVTSSPSQIQVDKYLMEVSIPEDDDPLIYWRWKRSDLPELAQLAVNVLATPASSAPVERLLSGTGRTVKPDQGCLSDAEFEELMFLRGNSHLD